MASGGERATTIYIRQMTPRDLPSAMRLKTVAGWNQTEADWRFFLESNPGGCCVAIDRGPPPGSERVVGTVTTLSYGPRLAWISMLLVDPVYRRQGIGTRLMQRAIEHLCDCETAMLDATPLGRPLYERLGFQGRYGLLRLVADKLPPVYGLPGITPISGQGFTGLSALDTRAFAASRETLLRSLWRRAPELAWYGERDGRVAGFCLGRRGTQYVQIGPLVAETSADAVAVCQHVLEELAGQAVVLDVPASQEGFLAWLRGRGFAVQRPFTRMVLGDGSVPGDVRCQFAIAGPEFG